MQEKLKNPPNNLERERELFCEEKLGKEQKKKWHIYSKREWIRRDKIKENERKDE